MNKNRNDTVDIIRGIAMLLVVLGHTMTGVTNNWEKSFVFNIVWSLQMPLFILISGYITKYGRKINDLSGLKKYIYKKTISYMLPWLVWTFFVRGLLFGEEAFLDIKYILWNMDSGYWFLATIWVISVIYACASFIAERIVSKESIKKQLVFLSAYIFGMIILVGIGLLVGFSFFAIKLTLYYIPFYFLGYLYGQYEEKIKSLNIGKNLIELIVAICLCVWLFIILRYSVYELSNELVEIIFRVITSITGCIAVCGLVSNLFKNIPGGVYFDGSEYILSKCISCII